MEWLTSLHPVVPPLLSLTGVTTFLGLAMLASGDTEDSDLHPLVPCLLISTVPLWGPPFLALLFVRGIYLTITRWESPKKREEMERLQEEERRRQRELQPYLKMVDEMVAEESRLRIVASNKRHYPAGE